MKKLLYLLLVFTIIGCSDSNGDSNGGYPSLSKELEDSVYLETGSYSENGNGIIYNWENYYTFDFETYAYIENGVDENPRRAECYTTHWVEGGALVSDSENSLTYIKNNITYTMTKISDNVLKIQRQGSTSNLTWEIVKSDFSALEEAKRGKRSSNTCD